MVGAARDRAHAGITSSRIVACHLMNGAIRLTALVAQVENTRYEFLANVGSLRRCVENPGNTHVLIALLVMGEIKNAEMSG